MLDRWPTGCCGRLLFCAFVRLHAAPALNGVVVEIFSIASTLANFKLFQCTLLCFWAAVSQVGTRRLVSWQSAKSMYCSCLEHATSTYLANVLGGDLTLTIYGASASFYEEALSRFLGIS